MFNAFNGQPGNYATWQMGYGNLQGNYSAPTVQNSFPQPNGFQVPHDPYAHYGAYPQHAGWQMAVTFQQHQPHQQAPPQQRDHQYHYFSAAPMSEAPPPIPDADPPPLPPMPVEDDPPPLPPDAPAGPAPNPPLPEGQPPVEQPRPPHVPPTQAASGIAAAEAWGMGHYPNSVPGQSQGSGNGGAWPSMQVAQHPQQAQFSHLGHAASHHYQHPFTQPHLSQPPPPSQQPLLMQQQQHAQSRHHRPAVPPHGHAVSLPGLSPAHQAHPAPTLPPAPVVLDITRLLRPPHRASRPRKLLLVLRGLPGSGKSTLARKIRDAEVEAGADAPRLHSMDDYYMQEVEVEVVEEEGGRKKRRKVTELKYVYEPEMEGTYFRDLVRAVGRSCEDRRYSFVVVDAPVLRAEHLRELMAVGQRANFECFTLLPLETDPVICASPARNVHNHSAEALSDMAALFEAAPPLYAQVSAVSLFGGPVVGEEQDAASGRTPAEESEIQEVDMDADDSDEGFDGGGSTNERGGGEDGPLRQAFPSRWHEDGDDSKSKSSERRQQRRKKREKATLRAVAEIDEKGILMGLNDALAATPDGKAAEEAKGRSLAALPKAARPPRPLKPALRQSSSSLAVVANGGNSKRRVWWPDVGQGCLPPAAGSTGTEPPASTSSAATALVAVVYLEGLGPPPELEDLPYGYQRRSLPGRQEAAGLSGEADTQSRAWSPHSHGSFRDQAKAEHESEHDLFRRLLLGRQGLSRAEEKGTAGGGSPLGLFAVPLEEEEDGT